MNPTAAPYQLLGFEVSNFTAKVRPALRYKQLWYEERRANLRCILKQTGLAFIPIVVSPDGEIWQDSTDIYERLEAAHPEPPLFPKPGLQRLVAHLLIRQALWTRRRNMLSPQGSLRTLTCG